MPPLSNNFIIPIFTDQNQYHFSLISFLLTLIVFSILAALSFKTKFIKRCISEHKTKQDIIFIALSCIIYLWVLVEIVTAILWINQGYNNQLFVLPVLLTLFTPLAFYLIYEKIELLIKLNITTTINTHIRQLKNTENMLNISNNKIHADNNILLDQNKNINTVINDKISKISELDKSLERRYKKPVEPEIIQPESTMKMCESHINDHSSETYNE
jgi:hypothetical protein